MLADDRRSWQLGSGRPLAADRRSSSPSRAPSTRSRCSRRTPRRSVAGRRRCPSRPRGRRRIDGPARDDATCCEAASLEVELKYRDDRRRDRRAAARRPTTSPGLPRPGPAETGPPARTATSTPTTARSRPRGYRRPAPVDGPGDHGHRAQGPGSASDDGGATHRREELEGPADADDRRPRWAAVRRPGRRRPDRRRARPCVTSSRSATLPQKRNLRAQRHRGRGVRRRRRGPRRCAGRRAVRRA